jgi:hypothetical protein
MFLGLIALTTAGGEDLLQALDYVMFTTLQSRSWINDASIHCHASAGTRPTLATANASTNVF